MQQPRSDEAEVIGIDRLVAKTSAVNERGGLRQDRIDGVCFRPIRPVPHEDGTLAEIARTAWDEIDQPICPGAFDHHDGWPGESLGVAQILD